MLKSTKTRLGKEQNKRDRAVFIMTQLKVKVRLQNREMEASCSVI